MFLLFCFILTTQGEKLLEYRLGYNYGQIFRDFSNNGLHAVNGISHLDSDQDTTATDRGAYFNGSLQSIMMPKNTISSSDFYLKPPFTIVCWVMALDSEGQFFTRSNSANQSLTIGRTGVTSVIGEGGFRRRTQFLNQLTFNGIGLGNSSGVLYGGPDSFLLTEWVMITMSVSNNSLQVFQNLVQVILHSFPDNYLESDSFQMYLGSGNSFLNSIESFVWYFAILDNEKEQENFISFRTSENLMCLTSSCNYCNYYVVDPYLGTGCISVQTLKNNDSQGNPCIDINYGCSNSGTLLCECSTNSCYQSGVNNYCWCPENITVVSNSSCVCPLGFNFVFDVCCESSCLTCRDNSTCLSCVDINAIPDSNLGCKCKQGFFGTKPLTNPSSCRECNPECLTCEDEKKCTACKSDHATPDSTTGCLCDSGYFGTSPLNSSTSCKPCKPECLTCKDANLCISCKSSNSSPSPSSGCLCENGFYSNGILSNSNSCLPCDAECKSCRSKDTCTTCLALNALPSSTKGCECIEGFFSQDPLTTAKSCISCHKDCKTCENPANCLTCLDRNAKPDDISGCICKKGYFFDEFLKICEKCRENCLECSSLNCLLCKEGSFGPFCLNCHSSCLTCSGPEFFDCLTCAGLMVKNTCAETCAIGFKNFDGICSYKQLEVPTVKFLFEGIGDAYFDEYNNVTARVSKGMRRRLTEFTPKVAAGRGIYFPGSSALEISEDCKFFNNEFSLSLWVRPKISSGVLVSKYDGGKVLKYFKLFFEELSLKIEILIKNSEQLIRTSRKLLPDKWNHIFICVNHSSNAVISSLINYQADSYLISQAPFIDSDSSFIMIGSDLLFEDSFKGFIYIIEVYAAYKDVETLVTISACLNCQVCLIGGTCLSLCEIYEFYDEKKNSCENCPNLCLESCLNFDTCLTCADSFCAFCSNFKKGSCYECFSGYELKKSCEKCKDQEFFDIKEKICKDCPLLCLTCDSASICKKCEENAKIVENRCECEEGYSFKGRCIRNYFTAKLEISETNSLTLMFSESLKKSLQKKMIVVQIDEKDADFSITTKNMEIFHIGISDDDIESDSILIIFFVEELVSEKNSLLETAFLKGNLHFTEEMKAERDLENKKNALKSIGNIGMTTGISLGLLVAVAIQDPSSLFDFLNTAEILYSVFLFDYQLHPDLSDFLEGMRVQAKVPNIFYLLLDYRKGFKLSELLKKFGYLTNLLLLNVGPHIESLFGILFSGFSIWIFSKITCCNKKLESVVKSFKFSAFLRFWIQTFYEICTALVYSFKYNNRKNAIQIVDYFFSFVFMGFEVAGIFIMIYLIKVRRRLTESEEIQKFMDKFGTFFDEFKERGVKDWIFYIIFILRRVVLVFCYSFINHAGVQLGFSLFFSLLTSLYFWRIGPNKQMIYNVYHLINELVISAYVIVLIVGYASDTLHSSEFKANLCIYLVYATWALNLFCGLVVLIHKIVLKIKEFLNKRMMKKTEIKYINKTAPDVIDTFQKVQTIQGVE